MKKVLIITSALFMAWVGFIPVGYAAYSGQNPCAFQARVLKKAGFVSGAYYDAACLRQILAKVHVIPGSCTQVDSCQYRYVCNEFHYKATHKLIPNRGPTIYWETTKPF